jgi:hypothetical protein
MNMKLIKILFLIILITSGELFSQVDKNGGSLYSIFGLGSLNYSTSTRTDGMGIMGIALYGKYSNALNPAAWTRIPVTSFSTKMELSRITSTDGINTAKRTYGNFETFGLAIPLNKGNGWIFDLSMHNYSSVNYDTKFSGSALGENYTQYYSGKGGIERISLGFSYIILKYFSFGAQFNYAFGNILKTTEIQFTNPSLFGTKNTLSNEIRGFYFNTGLIFHGFGKVFKNKKLDNLLLGVSFSTPFKMNSTVTGYFRKSTQTDSITITEGKVQIPWALGIGISNEFNNKLVVAADVYMQNWDNYKYYEVHPPEIKNNFRAGLGIEYTPSKRIEDPFIKKISYRVGGNYTMDYLFLNGEQIKSIGLNAGLSLPVSRFNSVDLSFSYMTKGKTSNGLIKDNVYSLGATVNIGELWFLKPSGDY